MMMKKKHEVLHCDQPLENVPLVHKYLIENACLPGVERCYSSNDVYWLWVAIHIEDYTLIKNVSQDHLIGMIQELISYFHLHNLEVCKLQKFIAEVSTDIEVAMRLLAMTIGAVGTASAVPALVLGGVVQSNPAFNDFILYFLVNEQP